MVQQNFVRNLIERIRYSDADDKKFYYLKRFLIRLTSRKTITQLQDEADESNELKRTLSSFQLLALGIGSIIGK